MRLTIYKKQKYISLDFSAKNLDKIKDFCYNEGIKYYTLSYSEKEMKEYEQFFKGHNKRNR
jgi:hypothetical protein